MHTGEGDDSVSRKRVIEDEEEEEEGGEQRIAIQGRGREGDYASEGMDQGRMTL